MPRRLQSGERECRPEQSADEFPKRLGRGASPLRVPDCVASLRRRCHGEGDDIFALTESRCMAPQHFGCASEYLHSEDREIVQVAKLHTNTPAPNISSIADSPLAFEVDVCCPPSGIGLKTIADDHLCVLATQKSCVDSTRGDCQSLRQAGATGQACDQQLQPNGYA